MKAGERINVKTETKVMHPRKNKRVSSLVLISNVFKNMYSNANRKKGKEKIGVAYNAVGSPRAGLRGGNANNGSNDGLGYVNVNNAVGNANANYGGRLSAFLYKSLAKTSRNDVLYSHHRTVGGIMFRLRVSKVSSEKAESSRI